MIKKSKSGGYDVYSHSTGRKFGHYKSKKAANKRIQEMEYFKKHPAVKGLKKAHKG